MFAFRLPFLIKTQRVFILPDHSESLPILPLKRRILFWLATRLGWLVLIALGKLTRIQFHGREHYESLRAARQPFIYSIWHGKIMVPIFVHRDEGICGMVSEHNDGEMIAQTLHRLGYTTVRGSSTRGGKRAMLAMIRILQTGGVGAIMPDGPRGPRHIFKAGLLAIAQKGHAAILPMTFVSTRVWCFKSWDQFTLPKPFSRTIALYGEPIFVPQEMNEAEFEAKRLEVEQRMLDLEAEAEVLFARKRKP